ncbi:MAG TPA: hypothetical protein VFF15_08235 [Flavobacteriaceae bacterium]|nr:hypothetical protein [Flavobacteriaceae bacterium]
METTYTIIAKRTGKIVFKFDLNGNLIFFSYEGEALTPEQVKWLYPKIPHHEKGMAQWLKIKEFTITKGEPDISFEVFWNAYGIKAKKIRAHKLYEKLTDDDKFNAIAGIKRYDNWLKLQRGIAKALPDTYLSQKRWLDEL